MSKSGLLALIAILAIFGVAAFLMANADPVGTAILQAQGSIAVAPITVSPIGGLWDLAVQTPIAVVLLLVLGGLGMFVYSKVKTVVQPKTMWKKGPGANFARIRPVKPPSLVDLLMLQLSHNLGLANRQQPTQPTMPEERRKAEW